MSTNLTEIQNRIASLIDESANAPDAGGTLWNQRLKYINLAQTEWSELYDWQSLYTEYNTQTSTATGNVSISLPSNFRKLAGYPKIAVSGVANCEFPEIRPQERSMYDASDRYVEIQGNPSDGYTMVVNPGTSNGQLASSTSIFVPYYKETSSLASPSDVSACPDPNYLVHKAVAMYWRASKDTRFPQQELESDKILQRMLDREVTHSEAAQTTQGRVRTQEEVRWGYRIGRDQ